MISISSFSLTDKRRIGTVNTAIPIKMRYEQTLAHFLSLDKASATAINEMVIAANSRKLDMEPAINDRQNITSDTVAYEYNATLAKVNGFRILKPNAGNQGPTVRRSY